MQMLTDVVYLLWLQLKVVVVNCNVCCADMLLVSMGECKVFLY